MVHDAYDAAKRLPVSFYRTLSESEPVREWLSGGKLSKEDRKLIGKDIAKVEYGWPIGMPTCRPLGDGLFEIRTDLPGNRITRVLFCVLDGRALLLHGFIKKATHGEKTPQKEIDLAKDRRKDAKRRACL